MAEDLIIPLLGYNDDEEDDTTDSDGKDTKHHKIVLILINVLIQKTVLITKRRTTRTRLPPIDAIVLNTTQHFPHNTTIWAKI